MKTIKYFIIVFLTFFLTNAYSQYNGGDADGNSSNLLSQTSCPTPSHFYAYFGGDSDGANVETLSSTMCVTPNSFFAYMGGDGNNSTVETLSSTVCGIPPSFFAYMGGDSDAANVNTLENTVCGFPPQFYAYFGGDGDGFTLDKTIPICPTEPPVASFTASVTQICVGQTVTFTDTSTNIPAGWTWTFEGGTPNSSTNQNPIITFNTAGTYDVTLMAANYNGTNTVVATDHITVYAYPVITSTTPASRCDSGTVTLEATTNVGTVNWYDAATAGNLVATGTSLTTSVLTSTTTYYVESLNGVCSSARTAVVATINATPSINSTSSNSRCDAGSVILNATSTAGNTIWYANPTGGTSLATTNNFNTPSISITTTYYVEAATGSCTSPRTAVIATVNTTPIITSTTPESRCDAGTVSLSATVNSGTINWYANASGGTSLATGASFITPNISASTNYYVEVTNGSCTSSRVAVTATINPTAAPTGFANQTFCAGETVGLIAVTGSNVIWYDAPTLGNVFPTGTVLVSGTTYYGSQTVSACESPTRIAVTMTLGSCLGRDEFEMNNLKVYPNPVVDILNISYTNTIAKVELINLLGQLVDAKFNNTTESQIDMSRLASGTYLIRITVDDNVKTVKVIKK